MSDAQLITKESIMSVSTKLLSVLALTAVALTSVNVYAVNPYKISGQDYPTITVHKENNGTLRGLEMRTIWKAQLNNVITKNKKTKKPEIIDITINAEQHHISVYPVAFYIARINCLTPTNSYLYEGGNENNSISMKNAMALDSSNDFHIDRKAVAGIFSAYCK